MVRLEGLSGVGLMEMMVIDEGGGWIGSVRGSWGFASWMEILGRSRGRRLGAPAAGWNVDISTLIHMAPANDATCARVLHLLQRQVMIYWSRRTVRLECLQVLLIEVLSTRQ